MLVLVGSLNPVKIGAVEDAFSRFFDGIEVQGFDVDSGVGDQPVGDDTLRGAHGRAAALADLDGRRGLGAAWFVGIEGGLVHLDDHWLACGAVCVLDRHGRRSMGTSPAFPLPDGVVEQLHEGRELGHVIDELSGDRGTKRRGGAIGHFTRGVMSRRELYVHGVVVALVPFLNERLYFGRSSGARAAATTDPEPGRQP